MPPEITEDELKAFKAAAAERDAAKSELEKLKAAPPPKKDDKSDDEEDDKDQELRDKAKADREAKDAEASKSKRLEAAVRFDMSSEKFLKDHSALLPSEVADIFKQASKENYSDAIEKDAAIKSGMIQSFFAVQANVDLLTAGQKTQLDDYLKLTKTGKQDKAQSTYEMIFEPAFEMLKRTKKAEALQSGHGDGGDDQYKQRLIAGSRKHYFGEK